MDIHPVLIDGQWRQADKIGIFCAWDPKEGDLINETYPVSSWLDCELALDAAVDAHQALQSLTHAPSSQNRISDFLHTYANMIEAESDGLVKQVHLETGYPVETRLLGFELPRTIEQIRWAAQETQSGRWRDITIDTKRNIRSYLSGIGPVAIFGPNNFPLACGCVSGGDFAAAIAAGCPVIAKAHPNHPGTTKMLAELALKAINETGLADGTIQMIYAIDHRYGEELVSDYRIGATAYTGSQRSGITLKAAADRAGKPIYLEMSSVNPLIILPGAMSEDFEKVHLDFVTSSLKGSGQFCTNPGLVFLIQCDETNRFIDETIRHFKETDPGNLLSKSVEDELDRSVGRLHHQGAEILTGGKPLDSFHFAYENTLLKVSARRFFERSTDFQTEAFGNCALFVIAEDENELFACLDMLEGNLTGSVYSASDGCEDELYDQIADILRPRVGRLLNDKMPTAFPLSESIHHGGPYPATGHPGFTAVGYPNSIRRFGMTQCFDDVRLHRLPPLLQDENPGEVWRCVDGNWTTNAIQPERSKPEN